MALGLGLVWAWPRWTVLAASGAPALLLLAFLAWDFGDGDVQRIAPHAAFFVIAGALLVRLRGKNKMSVGL